jgi:hypothetical protein
MVVTFRLRKGYRPHKLSLLATGGYLLVQLEATALLALPSADHRSGLDGLIGGVIVPAHATLAELQCSYYL